MNNSAPSSLKNITGFSTHRNSQVTVGVGWAVTVLDLSVLGSHRNSYGRDNTENPTSLLLHKELKIVSNRHRFVADENCTQGVCRFVSLIKRRQIGLRQQLAGVESEGLNLVVVDADPPVGVPHGDVVREVVEDGGAVDVEGGERGVRDADVDLAAENGGGDDDEDDEEEAEDEPEAEGELQDKAAVLFWCPGGWSARRRRRRRRQRGGDWGVERVLGVDFNHGWLMTTKRWREVWKSFV